MKRKKKRPTQSNSYPQFAIRVSEEDLSDIRDQLDKLHEKFNKGRDPSKEYAIKKNDIVLEALKIGFSELKKRSASK